MTEHEDDAPLTDAERLQLAALGLREYEVRLVRVEKIRRYTNNPRRNEQAVAKVKASIEEFGWQQHVVVDPDFVIIVGDTRYLAALEIGYPAIPVKVATDLTAAQIKAYRIADNRVHDESDWDEEKLTKELDELLAMHVDLTTTGMDDAEIKKLLEGDDEPALTEVKVAPLPTMTWVLIGIPTPRYIEIAEEIERISTVDDIFCELTANSDHASAHRKAAQLSRRHDDHV